MTDAAKVLTVLDEFQVEIRQQAINEVGQAVLDFLHKLGFEPQADRIATNRGAKKTNPHAPGTRQRGTP